MTKRTSLWTVVAALLMLGLASAPAGADEVAVANAEARRRAAENGLRAIKQKSAADAERVRALYTEAADRQNAWLDLTLSAGESSGAAAPDSQAVGAAAAAALIPWVNARNEALGQPTLSPADAAITMRAVTMNLAAITTSTWKDYRGANAQKRARDLGAMKERLRWKAFSEISEAAPAPGRLR